MFHPGVKKDEFHHKIWSAVDASKLSLNQLAIRASSPALAVAHRSSHRVLADRSRAETQRWMAQENVTVGSAETVVADAAERLLRMISDQWKLHVNFFFAYFRSELTSSEFKIMIIIALISAHLAFPFTCTPQVDWEGQLPHGEMGSAVMEGSIITRMISICK